MELGKRCNTDRTSKVDVRRIMVMVLVFLALHVGAAAQTAAQGQLENAVERLLEGLAGHDYTGVLELIGPNVVVDGLQSALDDLYPAWEESAYDTKALYMEPLAETLRDMFHDYAAEYYDGIDVVGFVLNYESTETYWIDDVEDIDWDAEFADDEDWWIDEYDDEDMWDDEDWWYDDDFWVDPYGEDWDSIWIELVRLYGDEWDETFGPDWDHENMEAHYYEMYLGAREWDRLWAHRWDDSWDDGWDDIWADLWGDDWDDSWNNDDWYDYMTEGEMAVFAAIAERMELYRPSEDVDTFVAEATALFSEYAVSEAAWWDALTWATADYFWVRPSAIAFAEDGLLTIPGDAFADMLFDEELQWNDEPLVNPAAGTTQLLVTSIHGDDEYLLSLRWEELGSQWQVVAANVQWSRSLIRYLEHMVDWIGWF